MIANLPEKDDTTSELKEQLNSYCNKHNLTLHYECQKDVLHIITISNDLDENVICVERLTCQEVLRAAANLVVQKIVFLR